jgi:hypothetical protein
MFLGIQTETIYMKTNYIYLVYMASYVEHYLASFRNGD